VTRARYALTDIGSTSPIPTSGSTRRSNRRFVAVTLEPPDESSAHSLKALQDAEQMGHETGEHQPQWEAPAFRKQGTEPGDSLSH
jgi:hypothetical protein